MRYAYSAASSVLYRKSSVPPINAKSQPNEGTTSSLLGFTVQPLDLPPHVNQPPVAPAEVSRRQPGVGEREGEVVLPGANVAVLLHPSVGVLVELLGGARRPM